MVPVATFRLAQENEYRNVADLIKKTVPRELSSLTVASQPGYANYVRACLKRHELCPQREIRVVKHENKHNLSGCADFRINSDDTAFLSYIAVSSDNQGRGLGRAMLDNFLSDFPHLRSISLDVFTSNRSAIRIYERLGFAAVGRTPYFTRKPNPFCELDGLSLINGPAADAQYERYGFTTYETAIGDRSMTIGQIGTRTIRAFSAADFSDPVFSSAATRITPNADTILHVGNIDGFQLEGTNRVAESLRMTRVLPA